MNFGSFSRVSEAHERVLRTLSNLRNSLQRLNLTLVRVLDVVSKQ